MKILFTLFTFLAFSIGANAKIITLECKIDKKISTRFLLNKTDESILSEEDAIDFMKLITLDTDKNSVSIEFPNLNSKHFPSHTETLHNNSSNYWFSYSEKLLQTIPIDTKISIDRTNLSFTTDEIEYSSSLGVKTAERKETGKCVVAVPKKTLI